MQHWTNEYLQRVVEVSSKHDQFKASQILKSKPSSIERMLREAKLRGLTPAGPGETKKTSVPNILVLDIETSLMTFDAWSPGKQYVRPDQILTDWYTHSWAVKWLFDPEVYSDVQTPQEAVDGDDERIIRAIWEFLDHADIVIIHNARFDKRKLTSKFIEYRLPPPSPYKIIDTLLVMRKEALFSSNKQDELAKKLGFSRKVEHEGRELWRKCFNGDPQSLLKMEEYNKGDIMSLEDLYVIIRPYIKSHPNMALYVESDGYVCPNCGSENVSYMDKTYNTNVNKFSAFRCECGAVGRSRVSELTKEQKPKLVSVAK